MNKKKFKRVLVVLAVTRERAVSLDSGRACIKVWKKSYVVSIFDPKNNDLNLINKQKIDVILMLTEGMARMGGSKLFEYLKIYYPFRSN